MFLEIVKQEIKNQNIKLGELSETTGISRQQLSGWLKEKKRLGEDNLIKLMKSLSLVIIKKFD
jgi:transcriptional regulator with XRE-family HTH domain